jgi:superfamily II DNA/RNA helicase
LRKLDGELRELGWKADERSMEKKERVAGKISVIKKKLQEKWDWAMRLDSAGISTILPSVDPARTIDGKPVISMIKDLYGDITAIEKFEVLVRKLQRSASSPTDLKDDKVDSLVAKIQSFAPGEKSLVFTQFTDTAIYLKDVLSRNGIKNVELVHGQMTDEQRDDRVVRFCPSYAPPLMVTRVKQRNGGIIPPGIDVLVATDAMSQSINLQEARYVINYDLPWNPMIMYQRNGRARRINNPNPVDIINFIPDEKIDGALKLVETLESKISEITRVIGIPSKILSAADKYKLTAAEVKEAFEKRLERVRTMGTGGTEMTSMEGDPVTRVIRDVIKKQGWTVDDVKKEGNREGTPYTIISGTTTGILFFYNVYRNTGDTGKKEAREFNKGAGFSGPSKPVKKFSPLMIAFPLKSMRRPVLESEMKIIDNVKKSTFPALMKSIVRSVHQTRTAARAGVKAEREKNKMLSLMNRSTILNKALNEKKEDTIVKRKVKNMVTILSSRKLITNDLLPRIITFINTWLKKNRPATGDTLKSMYADLEVIVSLTEGAGKVVKGKELTGDIDGYAIIRQEK